MSMPRMEPCLEIQHWYFCPARTTYTALGHEETGIILCRHFKIHLKCTQILIVEFDAVQYLHMLFKPRRCESYHLHGIGSDIEECPAETK